MKKHTTKFAVLGLLTIKPLSGYEMSKIIQKSIGHFWSESNGQLYPTLNQLLKDGFVTRTQPNTTSKKTAHIYAITEAGQIALQNWLQEQRETKNIHRDEELLRLFFGCNVPSNISLELLNARKKRAQETLNKFFAIHNELDESSEHYLYWLICLKNGVYSAKAEIEWCDEAIKIIMEQNI